MWTATLNFILSMSLLSPCLDVGVTLENLKTERTVLNRPLPIRKLSRFDPHDQSWREQSFEIRPGQIVLLHLWAVECKPCLDELKTLTPLLNGLREDRRLQILFVLSLIHIFEHSHERKCLTELGSTATDQGHSCTAEGGHDSYLGARHFTG